MSNSGIEHTVDLPHPELLYNPLTPCSTHDPLFQYGLEVVMLMLVCSYSFLRAIFTQLTSRKADSSQ